VLPSGAGSGVWANAEDADAASAITSAKREDLPWLMSREGSIIAASREPRAASCE